MYTISVSKECKCFKESAYENNLTFQNRDDALLQAELMINYMNTKFCKKHAFELLESGENFKITVEERSDPYGGCCGSGHCS